MLELLFGFVGEMISWFFERRVADEARDAWYLDRHSSDL
jgi:hypothetical protein